MQLPEDTYMHKGQRRKLLEELRTMGIQDERVLDAMDRVPRHYFLDSAFSQFAYSNKAFPIAAGQTISQPHTVAKQSELLCAKPGDNILEIGTGSGYQCAVLCALGFKVHSIERQTARGCHRVVPDALECHSRAAARWFTYPLHLSVARDSSLRPLRLARA